VAEYTHASKRIKSSLWVMPGLLAMGIAGMFFLMFKDEKEAA
jgi:hypothetical protein